MSPEIRFAYINVLTGRAGTFEFCSLLWPCLKQPQCLKYYLAHNRCSVNAVN